MLSLLGSRLAASRHAHVDTGHHLVGRACSGSRVTAALAPRHYSHRRHNCPGIPRATGRLSGGTRDRAGLRLTHVSPLERGEPNASFLIESKTLSSSASLLVDCGDELSKPPTTTTAVVALYQLTAQHLGTHPAEVAIEIPIPEENR